MLGVDAPKRNRRGDPHHDELEASDRVHAEEDAHRAERHRSRVHGEEPSLAAQYLVVRRPHEAHLALEHADGQKQGEVADRVGICREPPPHDRAHGEVEHVGQRQKQGQPVPEPDEPAPLLLYARLPQGGKQDHRELGDKHEEEVLQSEGERELAECLDAPLAVDDKARHAEDQHARDVREGQVYSHPRTRKRLHGSPGEGEQARVEQETRLHCAIRQGEALGGEVRDDVGLDRQDAEKHEAEDHRKERGLGNDDGLRVPPRLVDCLEHVPEEPRRVAYQNIRARHDEDERPLAIAHEAHAENADNRCEGHLEHHAAEELGRDGPPVELLRGLPSVDQVNPVVDPEEEEPGIARVEDEQLPVPELSGSQQLRHHEGDEHAEQQRHPLRRRSHPEVAQETPSVHRTPPRGSSPQAPHDVRAPSDSLLRVPSSSVEYRRSM